MSVKISPVFNDQTFDANGNLAVGYQLFIYAAGSSTKQTTYTDSTGGTPQTNPIILNSLGYPTNGSIWLTAGLNYKFVLCPPTDTDPPTSPVRPPIDNISGVNDASILISQWVSSGLTPTYISTTSFSLAGDQTTEFHVGRRVQLSTTSGTVYGVILTSAYTTLTTVTLTMDAGQTLDSGLSAVNLSLLRNDHLAIPAGFAKSGVNTDITKINGVTVIDTAVINELHGADIASASTINLTTATGNVVDVTGTTTITAITLAEGYERTVRFTGVLTLTNGASLVIPGGTNYTTAAGDYFTFRGYAAGVVRVTSYTLASGLPKSVTKGSFTVTLTGCTATITGTAYYTINGDSVVVDYPTLTGTSNSTSKTLTGIPSACQAGNAKNFSAFCLDSGTYFVGWGQQSAGTITLAKDGGGTAWTNSGTFTMRGPSVTYTLN
ncbi:MAG: hypothetical protein ACXWJZ_01225 [Burkholderiaceae bacterium]